MYFNDEVIQCEYVYDETKNSPQQNARKFSDPCNKDNSNSKDRDPTANKNLSDNKRSKRTKPKRQNSRYDEDNYALPDSESDGEVRIRKVDGKIRKIEDKMIVQGRQIFIWRLTSIAVILLLSGILAANLYLKFEAMETTGKKISIRLKI